MPEWDENGKQIPTKVTEWDEAGKPISATPQTPRSLWERGIDAMSGTTHRVGIPSDLAQEKSGQMIKAGVVGLQLPFAAGLARAAIAYPVATGKAVLGGLIGGAAGSAGGKWVGHNLPVVGGETAGNVLGTIGGLAGGVGGAAAGPKLAAGKLLQFATEGRAGMLQAIFGSGEAKAATVASEAAKVEAAALRTALLKARLEKTVAGTKALEQRVADSMRKVSIAEAREARLAKKAGMSVPEFRTVVAEAAPAAAPAATAPAAAPAALLPAGQRAMPTNLGGVAKPGPAPTPPEKLEETLQATLDALKAKKPGVLQPERIQIGAQRVGKQVGLTKEQVRMEAGPVLDEALGSASPLLPKQAYASIAEKIKTLPKGEARDAYVKLANSSKAMFNVEAIRRTLETQGLVFPFAAVAGLVIESQSKAGE